MRDVIDVSFSSPSYRHGLGSTLAINVACVVLNKHQARFMVIMWKRCLVNSRLWTFTHTQTEVDQWFHPNDSCDMR
jgi:hypothetical protein